MLVFSACERMYKKKLPKDLKPIDWVNYNDVYTVYWNNTNNCAKGDYRNENKKIKVYGWVWNPPNGDRDFSHEFTLIDDQSQIFASNLSDCRCIDIFLEKGVNVDTNEINLNKKCYVEGKLFFMCLTHNGGSSRTTVTFVRVYNSNDIYFEK
jgi:hypothetical protein